MEADSSSDESLRDTIVSEDLNEPIETNDIEGTINHLKI